MASVASDLSLSQLAQLAPEVAERLRARYADVIERTLVVRGLPKHIVAEDLYMISSNIREIKLFPKGSLGSSAMVEFKTKEAITQRVSQDIRTLCGASVDIARSTVSIRQMIEVELEHERRETAALRCELAFARKRALELQQELDGLRRSAGFWVGTPAADISATDTTSKSTSTSTTSSGGGGGSSSSSSSGATTDEFGVLHVPLSPEDAARQALALERWQELKEQGESKRYIVAISAMEHWRSWARRRGEERKNEELVRRMLNAEAEEIARTKTYPCPICGDDFPIDEIYLIDTCYHRYCTECMKMYLETKINEAQVRTIPCPNPDCNVAMHPGEVKILVSPAAYAKYEQFSLMSALNTMENLIWCPKAGCGNAMIGDPTRPLMVCSNPECQFTFCFNCKDEWHADSTCERWQEFKRLKGNADALYEEWLRENAKQCPNCHSPIEKNGGCNHMTCSHCRHEFCWLCSERYVSGHFNNGRCQQFT